MKVLQINSKSEGSILHPTDSFTILFIPLLGTVTCGVPILAQENIEEMIPISKSLVKPGSKYFLLRAKGNSMDLAGIKDGDMVLIRQVSSAENGERVLALIGDEATIKEFHRAGEVVTLLPKSSNPEHQKIIATNDLKIQGVVVANISKTQ